MQARYYDPITGRFLAADPIGYQDQLNLYAYVYNDPVNVTDPNGECPWCIGAAIGAVAKIVEIKASGGKVFTKEGLLQVAGSAALGAIGGQVAGSAALGAIGGQVGAVVSGGLKAAGVFAAAKAGVEAGKAVQVIGTIAADAAGGAAGGAASETVKQAASPGADNAAIAQSAIQGAVVGAAGSVLGQAAEGAAKAITKSEIVPAAAGATASAAVDAISSISQAAKRSPEPNVAPSCSAQHDC